ncbi:hypothetical protein K435DRAFT_562561, partial [Dendrothele bispora CBS 962.96]
LRPYHTEQVTMSNDRSNIDLLVRCIEYPVSSYRDLAFLIPKGFKEGDPPPKKFCVFMDNTTHTEEAVRVLRTYLPTPLHDKVKWFHSTMTPQYRDEELELFRRGETWGLAVTDAFGMINKLLPYIHSIVVQYRVTCDFNTLWQRFGRAGRALGSHATAIFLVEKSYFDSEHVKKQANAAKKKGIIEQNDENKE